MGTTNITVTRVNLSGSRDVSSLGCEHGPEAVGNFFLRLGRGRSCRWFVVYSWSRAGDVQRSALGLRPEFGLGERGEGKKWGAGLLCLARHVRAAGLTVHEFHD